MTTVYKIRHPSGNFSTGGRRPHWSKTGKIWHSQRTFAAHLSMGPRYPSDTQVITYQLTEQNTQCVQEAANDVEDRRIERENKRNNSVLKRKQREELKLLEELEAKYR